MPVTPSTTGDTGFLGHASSGTGDAPIVSDVGTPGPPWPTAVEMAKLQGVSVGVTPALKFDGGKVPMELLPAPALEAIAEVLAFGASKYTGLKQKELQSWLGQMLPNVNIRIEKRKAGGYVALVTTLSSSNTTSATTRKLQSTNENIETVIESTSTNMAERDRSDLAKIPSTSDSRRRVDSVENTPSQFRVGSNYWKDRVESVLSAKRSVPSSTPITAIVQAEFGASYALGATTVSAFLMTLSSLLSEQFNTSESLSRFETTGQWNWAKGFTWSRLIGAALRHLFAFARGEDRDPESGLSHLAHAGCCILFLITHERCKLGTDDRYKMETK